MEAGVALEGQQYLLLALDEGEGDALPLLGVVIPGELLDGLGHVCNRNTQFIPHQAAETALKCALFIPLGPAFICSSLGRKKLFLEERPPVLLGMGFPLSSPEFPSPQVPMESSWLCPIPWPCAGNIPNSSNSCAVGFRCIHMK